MDLNSCATSRREACMESMQSIVWNPLQDGMESSRRKCTFGDAMRLRRYHTRWRVITYQACGLNKKIDKSKLVDFFGWGTGIRTPVMTESESVALPLGDAPIFSTLCIITDNFAFVNRYLQKKIVLFQIFLRFSENIFLFFEFRPCFSFFALYKNVSLWYNTFTYLPVAQLDSASDSDSEGRRFESFRAGQKIRQVSTCRIFYPSRVPWYIITARFRAVRPTGDYAIFWICSVLWVSTMPAFEQFQQAFVQRMCLPWILPRLPLQGSKAAC